MKAMVYSKRNAPNVMRLTEIEKPVPTAGQVLVKIHSVSLNAAEYRSMQMAIGPRSGIYGADIAGRIEAVGPDTKKFKIGDAVFGDLSLNDFGGLAEYVAAPEILLAAKPDTVSFEQASAVPMASLTALQGLRDKGKIKSGDRVLIVGASGGVGLFAIQLAKYFGTHVTAVCSTRKAELAAKKAQQKRPAHKPNSNQATRKPKAPQVKLSAVDFTTLSAGSKVKVKVAEQAKNATVLNVEKDGARVELENGLVMTVTADRLFA